MSALGGLVGSLSRSKSAEVQRVWEISDDRLQFTARSDALGLVVSLDAGDVSGACLVVFCCGNCSR